MGRQLGKNPLWRDLFHDMMRSQSRPAPGTNDTKGRKDEDVYGNFRKGDCDCSGRNRCIGAAGAGISQGAPDTAFIISGLRRKRILIGKAGWRIPFFERVDRISLQVMTVDVKTSEAVPTNEFINVMVDGVANVKVSSDPELLDRAAEALLGMRQEELIAMLTQVLEGNMREIVGSVGLKEMVQDRQGVAKKITENVVPDMQKLGIEVVNFNIRISAIMRVPLRTWELTMSSKFAKTRRSPRQTRSAISPSRLRRPSRRPMPSRSNRRRKLRNRTQNSMCSKRR